MKKLQSQENITQIIQLYNSAYCLQFTFHRKKMGWSECINSAEDADWID